VSTARALDASVVKVKVDVDHRRRMLWTRGCTLDDQTTSLRQDYEESARAQVRRHSEQAVSEIDHRRASLRSHFLPLSDPDHRVAEIAQAA